MALFGTAGMPDEFTEKSGLEMPRWLNEYGLNAYEYQCGRGVNISTSTAEKLGKKAYENKISLSLHAPYYISLSSVKPEVRQRSIEHILKSAKAASAMGADRVVVHSGSLSGMSRDDAVEIAKATLLAAVKELDAHNLGHVALCPETMGKQNQLGTPKEVAELCLIDERLIPTIDFGHINARYGGSLKKADDIIKVLEIFENILGYDRIKHFHSHFSKIEYTAGGEKRHLTFEDDIYGPEFEPVAEAVYKKGCQPVFICESAGTQAKDAKQMRDIYESFKEGR